MVWKAFHAPGHSYYKLKGVLFVLNNALTRVTVPRMYAEHVAHLRVTYRNGRRDYATLC